MHCLLNISRRTKLNFLSALSSSFILIYFGFCYKLFNFLAVIDGYYICYPLIGQFDKTFPIIYGFSFYAIHANH